MRHKWFLVLACGWVLLEPPAKIPILFQLKVWLGLETSLPKPILDMESFEPDYAAPFSQWDYIEAFDTLKECQQDQSQRLQNASKGAKEGANRLKNKEANLEEVIRGNRFFSFVFYSRCFPASLQLQ